MKKINTFTLKIIAMATMITDHFAIVFVNENTTLYEILRSIGRLAFPLFIFMLIQGLFLTKDRKAYLKRLILFALISEPFYDLAFGHRFDSQNVYFTLALGFTAIYISEFAYSSKAKEYSSLINVVVTAVFTVLGFLLNVDYLGIGVLAISTGYNMYRYLKITKNKPKLAEIGTLTTVTITLSLLDFTELYGLVLIPILYLYNGEKGRNTRWFYLVYPVHLFIYYLGSILVAI